MSSGATFFVNKISSTEPTGITGGKCMAYTVLSETQAVKLGVLNQRLAHLNTKVEGWMQADYKKSVGVEDFVSWRKHL